MVYCLLYHCTYDIVYSANGHLLGGHELCGGLLRGLELLDLLDQLLLLSQGHGARLLSCRVVPCRVDSGHSSR